MDSRREAPSVGCRASSRKSAGFISRPGIVSSLAVICSSRRPVRSAMSMYGVAPGFSSAVTSWSGVIDFRRMNVPDRSWLARSRSTASSTNERRSARKPSVSRRWAIVVAVSPEPIVKLTCSVSVEAGSVSLGPRSARTMSATNEIPSAPGLSDAQSTTAPWTTGRRTVTSETRTIAARTSANTRNRRMPWWPPPEPRRLRPLP